MSYLLFFSLDMKKISKRIATTYILFFIGSYAASYAPGFWPTIQKGCVLGAMMWPPIYWHYSDESNYLFSYTRR